MILIDFTRAQMYTYFLLIADVQILSGVFTIVHITPTNKGESFSVAVPSMQIEIILSFAILVETPSQYKGTGLLVKNLHL